MVAEVLQSVLWGDPDICRSLGRYRFDGVVDTPAVFTQEVPPETEGWYIAMTEAAGEEFGTRGHRGFTMTVEIKVHGENQGSLAGLRHLGLRVWRVLHRRRVSVPGFGSTCVTCTTPATGEEDGFPVETIQCNLTLMED